MRSSPKDLRNGCTSENRRSAPTCQTPVTAVSMLGEPWMAVRCMWWNTERMPPSSSPPPARPGPPCTRCGTGEPWPVELRASSRLSTSTRPWWAAIPVTSCWATCGSFVQTDATREPLPSAASRTASPRSPSSYPITEATGPKASTECTSGRLRVGPVQQHRGHEGTVRHRAHAAVRSRHRRGVQRAVGQLAAGGHHGFDRGPDVGQLLQRRERTHSDAFAARVPQHHALPDPLCRPRR